MSYQEGRERGQRDLTTGKAGRILSFTTSGGVNEPRAFEGIDSMGSRYWWDRLDRRLAQCTMVIPQNWVDGIREGRSFQRINGLTAFVALSGRSVVCAVLDETVDFGRPFQQGLFARRGPNWKFLSFFFFLFRAKKQQLMGSSRRVREDM